MSKYEYLNKQGVRLLWEKINELLKTKLNFEIDTVANWATRGMKESKEGWIYIYKDYMPFEDTYIPGIKVGTGNAYIVDLPFTDAIYAQHILDSQIHVSQQDRQRWDNKITCYMSPDIQTRMIITKE